VFEAFGTLVRHVGPVGAGQLTKLVNNYIVAAHWATSDDEFRLVSTLGLNKDTAYEVLSTGTGMSSVFSDRARNRIAGKTSQGHEKGENYALQVLAKDVRLLREVLAEAGARMPRSDELITGWFERAMRYTDPNRAPGQ
jgi:3-hydroxyisobutyrate dehydrogenase